MGKKRKRGGLNLGPWPPAQIRRALESDGWCVASGGPHTQLRHPSRRGKVTVDMNWKGGVHYRDAVFGFMASQGGYTRKELRDLVNASD